MKTTKLAAATLLFFGPTLILPSVSMANSATPYANSITSCSFTPDPAEVGKGGLAPQLTQVLNGAPDQNSKVNLFAEYYVDENKINSTGLSLPHGSTIDSEWFEPWDETNNAGKTIRYDFYQVDGNLAKLGDAPLCSVTATYAANIPPVFQSGSTTPIVTAPETTVATYTTNGSVTWSITGGANQNLFEINSSGELTFKNASSPGTYEVTITATDALNDATSQTITVTVNAATAPSPTTENATPTNNAAPEPVASTPEVPVAQTSAVLPRTGTDNSNFQFAGLLFLFGGFGLLALRRRVDA